SDQADTDHPKKEKHGYKRAENIRDRSGGGNATDFRAHHRSSRGEGGVAKTSEMATARDRSGQTMWTKLAADGADAENAERVFFKCRGRRVSCTKFSNAAGPAASTKIRF